MYKILKWDFLNFINKNSWLYIGFAAVFIMVAGFPDRISFFSMLIDTLGALYSFFFLSYIQILSVGVTISWLGKDSAQLELALPVKPWKLLLAKLFLSICINVSGVLLTMQLWLMIGRFGMSKIVLFNNYLSFFQYLTGMLALITIIMFSYIAAKSFSFTRNKAKITTALLTIVIGTLLTGLVLLFYSITGVWNIVIQKHCVFFITPNEKFRWLITICDIIIPLSVIYFIFIGSCSLFKHKYKQH